MSWRGIITGALSAAIAGPALAATVVVGKPDWPSAAVSAHIIADVIGERFGADVLVRPMGTVELIGAIDRGEVDVHPEIWLPNLADAVNEHVNERGTLTVSPKGVTATQQMCTTRQTHEATGLSALSDLTDPEVAAHFDTDADGLGEVWIGARTWSSTPIERVRARSYGYDETMLLLTMPEDQAMAAVDAAVATGSPIVFYCYRPHYLFALHDVVTLEEPEHEPQTWQIVSAKEDPAWLSQSRAASAWEPSRFHIGYATQLAEDQPRIAAFLDAFTLSAEDAEAMSYAVHVERRSPEEIARSWIETNRERIEEWVE